MAANLKSNIAVRLGLITFPVSIQSAVASEPKESKLSVVCNGGLPVLDEKGNEVIDKDGKVVRQVHDAIKIKQTNTCPTCTKQGGYADFPRGKDHGGGAIQVLTDEQLEAVADEGVPEDVLRSITLTAHPADEVSHHTLPGKNLYYLAPGATAGETYPMMVELVKSRPNIAFCSVFAIKSAPAMYRLAVYNDRLALHQMAWPESINQVPALPSTAFSPALLEVAKKFIDDLMMPFDASTYKDGRRDVLNRFLDSSEAVVAATPQGEPAESPLLAALRAATATAPEVKVPKPRAPRKAAVKKSATVSNITERKSA